MPFLSVDSQAPDFSLKDQFGNEVSLSSVKGTWAVIYFYPKDDTPGCTKEACNFRDNHAAIEAAGAIVLGISGDSAATHQKFAAKHSLPFRLLVDEDHAVARSFGAWGTKNMYGKLYEGIVRSTFVIDPEGRIARVWPKVKPDAHGAEVLDWLKEHAG
jgi:peroxiredoxin Q/BCP